MGLKAEVVVVNEYSVLQPGGKGSRGGTPGAYVTRYMAREGATESLAPIQRLRTDDFILRYMARESAVERAGPSRLAAKTEMKQAQGDGGVAFGYGSLSLSDEQLRAASADIQRGFESGKTVMKTVLSFDESFLKRHGIVGEDFELSGRGGYRGHIDQMKLRMAIMHGLDRMSSGTSGFDDFRYVGVIQVDTEHVHCHLAAYDAGPGRLANDGTQRGKLLDRHKSRLRRGIDSYLDEKQAVAHLSSAVGYERRNVTTFIKRWAHDRIRQDSLPQFLLACLPADRSLWRAGSNRPEMRKANRLVSELVDEQLARPGSPLPAAMEKITDYADHRRQTEDLSAQQWRMLVDRGRSQVTERAVNGVYQMLRALPESELRVRTPMLEVMSMDDEQLAVMAADSQVNGRDEDDDIVSFGFRLRSYGSRLRHHGDRARSYRDLAKQWERAEKADVADEDSRPLYDFYHFEADYHRRLVAKYQHFLPFLADANQWAEQQQALEGYGQRLLSLIALRNDASLQRMKDAEAAEALGREIYDQPGGRHLTEGKAGRAVLDDRIRTMNRIYDERLDDLRTDLAASGLVLRADRDDEGDAEAGEPTPGEDVAIVPGAEHSFEEVKSLDLHHLGYDFVSNVEVGRAAEQEFRTATAERRRLLMGAMEYLDASGQSEAILDLPVDDVAAMVSAAEGLREREDSPALLRSRIADLRAEEEQRRIARRSKATSLDAGLVVRVRERVDEAVATVDSGLDVPDDSPEAQHD